VQFNLPLAIAIDKDDNIFVADWRNFRVQMISTSGEFIRSWQVHNSQDDDLTELQFVTTDNEGYVYVSEPFDFRVQKFSILKLTTHAPLSGAIGDNVVITGAGFSEVSNENTVEFNGIAATVLDASKSSVSVTVPDNATTGKISLRRAGYTVVSAEDFVVEAVTGLKENTESTIQIYPNPANEIVFVRTSYSSTLKNVQVLDSKGSLIFKQDKILKNSFSIDTRQWTSGLFLLLATDVSGKIYSLRFIKE
jgi:hypothetical protein